MIQETFVHLATPEDAHDAAEWVVSTPQNGLDYDRQPHASDLMLCVEVDGAPTLYVPVYPALVIGAAGLRPEATAREYVTALKAASTALENLARSTGLAELITFSSYAPTRKALERLGAGVVHGETLRKIV